MTGAHVDMQKRVRTWAPRRADIAAWTNAALGRRARNRELSVRVVGRAESRRLNAHYRGKDYATNVLSFPAPPLPARTPRGAEVLALGDLVICPPVLRREAQEQSKSLRAHWAHLVVHGTLHLLGHDHETSEVDAERMEALERRILARLGIADPY
jgi:probable rRNA maturation factor